MKYRIETAMGGGFIVMTQDGGKWKEVSEYCGGPAGNCTKEFDTVKEAKKWIKDDIKDRKNRIVFEFDSQTDTL